MAKLKFPLILLAIVAVLAVVKIFYLTPKDTKAGPGKGPAPVAPVSIYVVKSEILDNKVYSSGTISANEEVELHPEVSGKIVHLNIQEGKHVRKGELLLKINDADLQAQLRKLELQIKLAQEREQRQKKLLEINGVSQEDYDIAMNQLGTIYADVDFTKAQIDKTEIRAPFDGVIGLRKISNGAYVTPLNVIATVQQIRPIKIDFSVPERYSDKIKTGDQIRFTIQGLGETFIGKIYAIDPKVDLSTRTVQLRALCNNQGEKIFPGSFARVELILASMPNAILVPTQSVVPILKGQKVFVFKNGEAVEQIVETGIRTDSQIEITKGISPGDSVITTGIMSIKQGTKVRLK